MKRIITLTIICLCLFSCTTPKDRFNKASKFGEVLFQLRPIATQRSDEDIIIIKSNDGMVTLLIVTNKTFKQEPEISFKLNLGNLCNTPRPIYPENEYKND